MWAVEDNNFEILRYLTEQGSDKEKTDNDGNTALIHAANHGQLEALSYLVEQGADKEKSNYKGMTPLITAAHRGY